MKMYVLAKERYEKEGNIKFNYLFWRSVKDKNNVLTPLLITTNSTEEYNIGDMVDVSKSKNTNNYFISNRNNK